MCSGVEYMIPERPKEEEGRDSPNMENRDCSDIWQDLRQHIGSNKIQMGSFFTYNITQNPRWLLHTCSRYKFAARLIGESPKVTILELGCGEGYGTLLLAEHSHNVTGVDFDAESITWAQANLNFKKNIIFKHDDFVGKTYGKFDVVVSLDVLEHIPDGDIFFETVTNNLKADGYSIIGTPNITASKYASQVSRMSHVNLFSAERLRDMARKHFKNVFLFGMNDEVVHTGYYPMCHYLIVLGCTPIKVGI